jgi:3-oxoacyl-[acyl-carrier protein] reductase
VNTVAPGPTATPLFLDGKSEETVAFLAGPARWVNGQVIYTNGGVI